MWWNGGRRERRVRARLGGRAAHRRLEHEAPEVELGEDCAAFLVGRLAETHEARGVVVPVWAWANLLAHGSEEELAQAAASSPSAAAPNAGWRKARSYLAARVIAAAGTAASLGELQHRVLVPLELELAARTDVVWWGPQQLVGSIERALAGPSWRADRHEQGWY
ncbi:MAG TPA: hypothetical protein VMU75_06740 [Acidimicrobiales bacterium]|nr:hypothetical protein [Acidimicrobiales bacterium]